MTEYASIIITVGIQAVTGIVFILSLKTKIEVLKTELKHLREQLASMFLAVDEKIKTHEQRSNEVCNLRHDRKV